MVQEASLLAPPAQGNPNLSRAPRLQDVGLAEPGGFPMPLTQEMLADLLGLSIVHVNRTLQQMRLDGLFELKSGCLLQPDRARLAIHADLPAGPVSTAGWPHALARQAGTGN